MSWWIRYISPPNGIILDPFMGAGTAALVALDCNRNFIGIEKMQKYHSIAQQRVEQKLSELK